MRRRALLLALLTYVSLDLSLAGMPGAFVFDPADSVESAQGARTRAPSPLLAVPASAAETSTTPAPARATPTVTPVSPVAQAVGIVSLLPRAVLAPAVSEDAH